MDGHNCMDTCTRTHTHTCKPHSEQLGVFAVWVGRSFSSLSHTMTHALSVFALHLTQTACVSVLLPFKHTLRLAFVKTHTNREGLAPGRNGKTRAKFIEKSTRISEMHLIHFAPCFLRRQLIIFWHSNQGHRDISCALFHVLNNGSHEDKLAIENKLVHQVHKASGSL